ncbi:tRNA pseudouridine synthase B [Labeo rohita]|uniref:tRNA pseudouridine synthase B n=1 Tax=Labeo rohita TaxID=84645 RepID=A0ABQ8L7R0_LABRO|nr:tRNA pseudouridine synthase B [Labeo rohita]
MRRPITSTRPPPKVFVPTDSELLNPESKASTRRHPAFPQCQALLQKDTSQQRTEMSPWQPTQVPDHPLGEAMKNVILSLRIPWYVQQQSTTTSSSTAHAQVLNGGCTMTAGHTHF